MTFRAPLCILGTKVQKIDNTQLCSIDVFLKCCGFSDNQSCVCVCVCVSLFTCLLLRTVLVVE